MPTFDPKNDPYAEIPVKDFSYTSNPNPVSPVQPDNSQAPKVNKKWMYIVAAAVVLIIVAAFAFLFIHHHKTSSPPKKSTTSKTVSQANTSSSGSFGLSFNPSTLYTSNNYNLEVTIPKSWTVNDTTSSLTITSPVTQLKNDTGQNTNGKILVSVFNQGTIPTAFGNNNSVAVLASTKISYSNPTQDQASQTYISFIQYPATTVKGGLDAIYVTGNNGYKYAQNIPNSDISGLSPLVIISFLGCSNAACTNPTSLTISSTEWNNSGFSSLIENIVKSFIFN